MDHCFSNLAITAERMGPLGIGGPDRGASQPGAQGAAPVKGQGRMAREKPEDLGG
jgi:hypothetical protein